jgi:ApaG protein
MATSEAVTRGIRVRVHAQYSPGHSQPTTNKWFFLYTVVISNESDQTVQLVTRHWIITDATGHVEEVRGPGVVGQQPVLEPGRSFEYTSGCPLSSPYGTMHGSYHLITADGHQFDAKVATFQLQAPFTIH